MEISRYWYENLTYDGRSLLIKSFPVLINNLNYFYLPSNFGYCEEQNLRFVPNNKPIVKMIVLDLDSVSYRLEWLEEMLLGLKEDIEEQLLLHWIDGIVSVRWRRIEDTEWGGLDFEGLEYCFIVEIVVNNLLEVVGPENVRGTAEYEIDRISDRIGAIL